jgi:hypothetical protein
LTDISPSSCMKSVAVAIATALERSCIIARKVALATGLFVMFAVLIYCQLDAAVHANVFLREDRAGCCCQQQK